MLIPTNLTGLCAVLSRGCCCSDRSECRFVPLNMGLPCFSWEASPAELKESTLHPKSNQEKREWLSKMKKTHSFSTLAYFSLVSSCIQIIKEKPSSSFPSHRVFMFAVARELLSSPSCPRKSTFRPLERVQIDVLKAPKTNEHKSLFGLSVLLCYVF